MARLEHDREDLIAEATALRTRVELTVPQCAEPVVVGQRSNSWLSVYFGPDPVYHFDSAGGLRRAFVDGHLFRSERGTLSRLVRHRPDEQTSELLRTDLSTAELELFFTDLRAKLDQLCAAIDSQQATVLRQVSSEPHPVELLRKSLETARAGRLSSEIRGR